MIPSLAFDNGRLNRAQTAQYWEDGFLFPIRAATAETAHNWRLRLENIESDYIDAGLPLPLNTYKRVKSQIVMPLAYEIGTEPGVLDVVEDLLGPDILLYATEFLSRSHEPPMSSQCTRT